MEKVEARVSKESDKRTPAQIAYDKVQEQRVISTMGVKYLCVTAYFVFTQQAERILKKAQRTHKQRVEVNSKL